MILQTINNIFKRCKTGVVGETVKYDVGAMTIVVFTIAETRYLLEGLFNPFRFCVCDFKFFGCAASFNSGDFEKSGSAGIAHRIPHQ